MIYLPPPFQAPLYPEQVGRHCRVVETHASDTGRTTLPGMVRLRHLPPAPFVVEFVEGGGRGIADEKELKEES